MWTRIQQKAFFPYPFYDLYFSNLKDALLIRIHQRFLFVWGHVYRSLIPYTFIKKGRAKSAPPPITLRKSIWAGPGYIITSRDWISKP